MLYCNMISNLAFWGEVCALRLSEFNRSSPGRMGDILEDGIDGVFVLCGGSITFSIFKLCQITLLKINYTLECN